MKAWCVVLVCASSLALGCGQSESGNDVETAPVGVSTESDSSTIEKEEDFLVEGVAKVPTPRGFTWQLLDKSQKRGVEFYALLCTKEGSKSAIMLLIERRAVRDDAARMAVLQNHYNVLMSGLQDRKFTNVIGKRPASEPPIPDRVSFDVNGRMPDGTPTEIRAVTVFGNNLFSFEAFSTDKAETAQLFGVAEDFTELDTPQEPAPEGTTANPPMDGSKRPAADTTPDGGLNGAESQGDLNETSGTQPEQSAKPGPTPIQVDSEPSVGSEARAARITVDGANLVSQLAWSRDGMQLVTLTKNGLLQKFSLPDLREVQSKELGGTCSFLGRSKEGIVAVLDGLEQIYSIDDSSLEVLRQVRVDGVSHVACAPATPVVYAPSGQSLFAIDLRDGSKQELEVKLQLIERSHKSPHAAFNYVTLTPDGKYLFSGGSAIQRGRVDGLSVIVEEFSAQICSGIHEVLVSDDSQFVAMPAGEGNRADGHPVVGYGTYIYSATDLQSPYLGISTRAYPRMLAFDPVAKSIYAQNADKHIIVLNQGGVKQVEYFLRAKRGDVRRFLVHPSGYRLCVLTRTELIWVELPGSEKTQLGFRLSAPTPAREGQPFRTWTDNTGGFQITAKLVEVGEDYVTLQRKDGVTSEVPMERLSENDRQFARKQ